MEKHTILVVDDEPQNLHILIEILKLDYQVKITKSGDRALDIVSKHKPDLILLDVNMPGMDGYEVCEQLKAGDATRSVPVIFLSGSMTEDDRKKGLELGAVEFVKKPVDAGELKQLIEDTLA
jgi:putative two-component system response regulator